MRSAFWRTSTSASTMTTSSPDFSGPSVNPAEAPATDPSALLTAAIGRLANELFSGGSSVPGGAPVLGALPPVPGALATPPLPMSPPPKESDLRTLPAMLSETLSVSPVALVSAGNAAPAAPYFLDLAGHQGAPGGELPSSFGLAQPPALPTFGGAPS